jgi:hypothetical protein
VNNYKCNLKQNTFDVFSWDTRPGLADFNPLEGPKFIKDTPDGCTCVNMFGWGRGLIHYNVLIYKS